jgi:cytochrome c-type biogenesis protein CcmE
MSRVNASCSCGVAGLSLMLQQTRLAAAYGLAIELLTDNVQHVNSHYQGSLPDFMAENGGLAAEMPYTSY